MNLHSIWSAFLVITQKQTYSKKLKGLHPVGRKQSAVPFTVHAYCCCRMSPQPAPNPALGVPCPLLLIVLATLTRSVSYPRQHAMICTIFDRFCSGWNCSVTINIAQLAPPCEARFNSACSPHSFDLGAENIEKSGLLYVVPLSPVLAKHATSSVRNPGATP